MTATQPGRRTLEGLLARFTAEGRLRGTRLGGRPAAAADLASTEVTGVTLDSREVRPGSLFMAIPGLHQDGHDFAPAAVEAGAAGLIVERPVPGVAAAQIVVDGARPALASAAAWWYGDPSHELTVVGITGTDGKTTTAYLAVAALEAAGMRTGMIGTIATRIGGKTDDHAAHATTPEAPELQRTLRAMVDAGDRVAVIETTSHGLALDRVASVAYDVAILTNVTHEHLELHGTWEAYRDAKLSLFDRLRVGRGITKPHPVAATAIVNLDDPSAGLFVGTSRDAGARVITYGTESAADVRATRITEDSQGLHADVTTTRGETAIDLRLAGRFNVHNALAVLALGEALELDPSKVRHGLASLEVVPGRMERIERGQPFGVVVDFAHSPASLTTVLDLLAPAAAARGGGLIAVFGSAGERDTAKRPQMGRIAGERARFVVVTDEDPRGEDREAILDEIARGAEAAGRRRGHDLLLIAERRAAIAAAFEAARPGDIVLLAGKGHEQSIIGPDGEQPWNERAVAEELLAELRVHGRRALTGPRQRRSAITLAAFVALVVLVGTNLVAIRFTNRELAPLWNAGLRFALAAALFAVIALIRRSELPAARIAVGSAVYGLLAFAAFFAFVYTGLVNATAALGQTVLALGPLITLLVATAAGMEPLRGRAVAAAAFAVIGIGIAFGAQQHLDVPLVSVVALAAGATSFAAAGILAKRLPPADPVVQNAIGTAVGAIVLLTLSRIAVEPWAMPQSAATWLWFAYLVIPGTVVIFLLFLYLIRRLPATVVSYQFVLAPIVSITLGYIVLSEPIGPGTLVGAAIVAGSVYLGALSGGPR